MWVHSGCEHTGIISRLVSIDRSQLLLRTVDVERLIDEDHPVRAIWQLVGRLDLGLYYAEIASVEGGPGASTPIRSC